MLRFATRFPPRNRLVLYACAVALVVVAANHALLAARGQGDVVRHWVFVAVNVAAAAIVARAPRWALWPISVLAAQQTWSHGNDLVRDGDLPSLGVIVFFPIVITALVVERRRRTTDRTGPPTTAPRG